MVKDFVLNGTATIQDDDDGPKYDASRGLHDEEVVVEDDVEAGVSVNRSYGRLSNVSGGMRCCYKLAVDHHPPRILLLHLPPPFSVFIYLTAYLLCQRRA